MSWLSRRSARVLLVLLLAVITLLALLPQQEISIGTGWDKLNHVLAFVVLGFLALVGSSRGWALPLSGLLAYGVALELLQGLTPGRVASLADIVADLVGLLLGLLAYRCWQIAQQCSLPVGASVGEQAE